MQEIFNGLLASARLRCYEKTAVKALVILLGNRGLGVRGGMGNGSLRLDCSHID